MPTINNQTTLIEFATLWTILDQINPKVNQNKKYHRKKYCQNVLKTGFVRNAVTEQRNEVKRHVISKMLSVSGQVASKKGTNEKNSV